MRKIVLIFIGLLMITQCYSQTRLFKRAFIGDSLIGLTKYRIHLKDTLVFRDGSKQVTAYTGVSGLADSQLVHKYNSHSIYAPYTLRLKDTLLFINSNTKQVTAYLADSQLVHKYNSHIDYVPNTLKIKDTLKFGNGTNLVTATPYTASTGISISTYAISQSNYAKYIITADSNGDTLTLAGGSYTPFVAATSGIVIPTNTIWRISCDCAVKDSLTSGRVFHWNMGLFRGNSGTATLSTVDSLSNTNYFFGYGYNYSMSFTADNTNKSLIIIGKGGYRHTRRSQWTCYIRYIDALKQ